MSESKKNPIAFLENMQTSFQKMKFVTVASVVMAVIVSLGSLIAAFSFVTKTGSQVFVLDDGVISTAFRAEGDVQRELESRDQLETFHKLFFNLAPNRETININNAKMLQMADNSAARYLNTLEETQFYRNLIQNGCTQEVIVDSIKLNMTTRPYRAHTYLTRYYNRSSNITKYHMETTCTLSEVQRTMENPHGLFVGNFAVVANSEIETRVIGR